VETLLQFRFLGCAYGLLMWVLAVRVFGQEHSGAIEQSTVAINKRELSKSASWKGRMVRRRPWIRERHWDARRGYRRDEERRL